MERPPPWDIVIPERAASCPKCGAERRQVDIAWLLALGNVLLCAGLLAGGAIFLSSLQSGAAGGAGGPVWTPIGGVPREALWWGLLPGFVGLEILLHFAIRDHRKKAWIHAGFFLLICAGGLALLIGLALGLL